MSLTTLQPLGSTLYVKLIKAELASRECQADFDRLTLSQKDHVAGWESMVTAWEADHSQPDPYVVVKSGECLSRWRRSIPISKFR